MPPLLYPANPPQAPHVRGPARLFPRGPSLSAGRSPPRLFPRRLPRPLSRVSPQSCPHLLCDFAPRPPGTAQEVRRPHDRDRPTQAEPLGLRDQRSPPGKEASTQSNRRSRNPQARRVRASSPPTGRRPSPAAAPHHRGRGGCACLLARFPFLRHRLWWALPPRARSGPPRRLGAGGGSSPTRLQDDPCRARAAGLSRPQAVVHRAQEPCHVAGHRPGTGAVLRTQCHPQEELSLRVLLPGGARHDGKNACRLADARRPDRVAPGAILQPRFPLRSLLWGGSCGGAPLRLRA